MYRYDVCNPYLNGGNVNSVTYTHTRRENESLYERYCTDKLKRIIFSSHPKRFAVIHNDVHRFSLHSITHYVKRFEKIVSFLEEVDVIYRSINSLLCSLIAYVKFLIIAIFKQNSFLIVFFVLAHVCDSFAE